MVKDELTRGMKEDEDEGRGMHSDEEETKTIGKQGREI